MSTVTQEPTIALPVHDQTGLPLTYDVAYLFPHQGEWTEADYWALPERQRIIELAEGRLCIPPMPTDSHQRIEIYQLLDTTYRQIATYTDTDQIQTPLLPGFSLHGAEIFSE